MTCDSFAPGLYKATVAPRTFRQGLSVVVLTASCGGSVQAPPERCDPSGPLSYPNESTSLLDADGAPLTDPEPTLSGDELTAYVTAERDGVVGLYRASRTSRDTAFGRAVRLGGAQGVLAGVSTDGERVYLGVGAAAVRRARFVAPDSLVPDGDEEFPGGIDFVGGILVSANEAVVAYGKTSLAAAMRDPPIYRRDKLAGRWGVETESGARGYVGALSADGAHLTVGWRLPGGVGSLHSYSAEQGGARYGKPVQVGKVSPVFATWMSPDACRLYVSGSAGPVTGQRNHTINWLERVR